MSDNLDNQDTFYLVPRWVRKLPGMTLQKLDFFETVFQFLHKGKSCYLYNSAIKERTGIKSDGHLNEYFKYFELNNVIKRTVIDGVRYFELVSIRVGVKNKSNIYPHPSPQGEGGGLPTGSLGVSPEGDQNRSKVKRLSNKSIRLFNFTKEELEVKTLITNRLKNDTLNAKQARELLKICGNIKNIEIALTNCLVQLAKPRKGKPISNRLAYFIKSVQNNSGYFPDQIKTKDKDPDEVRRRENELNKDMNLDEMMQQALNNFQPKTFEDMLAETEAELGFSLTNSN